MRFQEENGARSRAPGAVLRPPAEALPLPTPGTSSGRSKWSGRGPARESSGWRASARPGRALGHHGGAPTPPTCRRGQPGRERSRHRLGSARAVLGLRRGWGPGAVVASCSLRAGFVHLVGAGAQSTWARGEFVGRGSWLPPGVSGRARSRGAVRAGAAARWPARAGVEDRQVPVPWRVRLTRAGCLGASGLGHGQVDSAVGRAGQVRARPERAVPGLSPDLSAAGHLNRRPAGCALLGIPRTAHGAPSPASQVSTPGRWRQLLETRCSRTASFWVLMAFSLSPPARRQMCNTSMSVSPDGAVSTSQVPASEQETLVGIFVSKGNFQKYFTCWRGQLNQADPPDHSRAS